MSKDIVVTVENFGPFEHAEIKLRPLTIFIGRNSVGKSMLMRLLWALASTPVTLPPHFLFLPEGLYERLGEVRSRIIDNVVKGLEPSRDDVHTLIKLYIEVFQETLVQNLKGRIQGVFGSSLEELIRVGAETSRISISEPCGPTTIVIKGNDVKFENLNLCLDDLLDRMVVEVPTPGILGLKYEGISVARSVRTSYDLVSLISEFMVRYFGTLYTKGFYIGSGWPDGVFLPDSRAGVVRLTIPPSPMPYPRLTSLFGPHLTLDEEFVNAMLRIAQVFGESRLVEALELAEDFLEELGCGLELKPVGGVYAVYVRMWSGKELPLPLAPSGVRESIATVLALTFPEPSMVFIEEPEAHLHPRAVTRLARLIGVAVRYKGMIIVSTHSDHLLVALNNLIALSKVKGGAERPGFRGVEAINPAMVAAYLVVAEGGRAVVRELRVEDTGIPEDEFAKVTEELLEERSRIYDELQGAQL
ncbi:MAG: AAA family ATPase [Desulfurococcales archaeon]|nr:AAA family ATPase [Desulfurococcales archaeon]